MSKRITPLSASAAAACLALLLSASDSAALPGTQGPAASTWDTTRSTIMFSFHGGLFDGGHLHIASYNSNFTSTTGKLSAQFGLHYLNYAQGGDPDVIHGLGATAMAVYGIPVADRYDNGLPKAAFTFFLGGAPSALISNANNMFTFAIPLGIALPWSPSRYVTIGPWIEVDPSFNVDTHTESYDADDVDMDEWEDPATGDLHLSEEEVANILKGAVKTDLYFAAKLRGGLSLVFHLGDRVDLHFNGAVSHIGKEFNGPVSFFFGGGIAIAWDDPPAAVLPSKERLKSEQCKEIYDRFTECPFYPKMIKKARAQGYEKCLEVNECRAKPKTPTNPPANDAPPAEGPPAP